MAYISDSRVRSSTLYQCKATLFYKACALHTMTKAEVIIVIDHEGQRLVRSSLGLLETYNKGTLKPTKQSTGMTLWTLQQTLIPMKSTHFKTLLNISILVDVWLALWGIHQREMWLVSLHLERSCTMGIVPML